MSAARLARIEEACNDALIVRFSSPYEPGNSLGYVLDTGRKFFLLGLIDDHIRFNGFQCHRYVDVRKLKVPAPTHQFIVAALRIRGESIDEKPDINLDNVSSLLQSASQLFPLVTIHREKISPDTCKIGKVLELTNTKVRLLEIDTDAAWENRTTTLRLDDITRVDFRGDYEGALHLVGGDPDYPPRSPKSKSKVQ